MCFVLGSPGLPRGRRESSSFEENGQSIRRKRRISIAIEREKTRLLNWLQNRHARRLWFPGPNTTGDSSDKKGEMGAGYNKLGEKIKSSIAKWDERKRTPAQISLNWQRFY